MEIQETVPLAPLFLSKWEKTRLNHFSISLPLFPICIPIIPIPIPTPASPAHKTPRKQKQTPGRSNGNDIADFRVGHYIRGDAVPGFGSLLEGVGVPDQTGFAPGGAQETNSEPACA